MSKNESKLNLIWKNRKAILEGVKNRVFQNEAVEEIAALRLSECEKCPSYDREGTECIVPGTAPCCGECGCSLALKKRSLSSSCPIGKWEAVLTDEEDLDHEALNPEDND